MNGNDCFDATLYQAIRELVERGELEKRSAAHRIAQQVIHQGYDSLSTKQREVYDAAVTPALLKHAQKLDTLSEAQIPFA